MQRVFTIPFMIDGALAANHTFTFKAPFDMTLIHVSLSNSSANAGSLDIGLSTDTDGWKDGAAFGVSGACTELAAFSDFDGAVANGQYPTAANGDLTATAYSDLYTGAYGRVAICSNQHGDPR